MASNRTIDADEFENYSSETGKLFVRLYPWFYMPSSVHKILMHGAKVIKRFYLPIVQFTEEAAEARNKDFNRFRKFNTRKISRRAMNEDLIHKSLISSDPQLASKRNRQISGSFEVDD